MTHVPTDEELRASIERLSHEDDEGNVILKKNEAKEVRQMLILFRKMKLIKAFLGYVIAGVAAYAAFKADIASLFGSGK